jgi:hypothetical protein
VPIQTDLTIDGTRWTCALPPDNPAEWAELVANGCPAGLAALSESFSAAQLDELFNSLGFYQAPTLPLPVAASSAQRVQQVTLSAIGQENLTVTPLQMALAAAALTNDGIRPIPNLASTVQTPHQGWVVLSSSETVSTLLANKTTGTMNLLSMQNGHFWQVTGAAQANNDTALAWYLAGTLPEWQGTPLALALVLEGETPQSALEIGRALIQGATQ